MAVALASVTLVGPASGHVHTANGAAPGDLPEAGPAALHGTPPRLPTPEAWPFGEAFPRTSGTGRYAGGAHLWSDFLYDDHGAVAGPPRNESVGAVSFGSYTYPEPAQAGNGADLFRLGIGLDTRRTWWRVDWNTLTDPGVPIAAFVLDTDADATTGTATWPAGAEVSSPGIERALVVSGSGAWLWDVPAGTRTAVEDLGGGHHVDVGARSFVVSLPRRHLEPEGTWTVRAGAGLADAAGHGFLALTPEHGARPGGANLYNVGYRDYEHEPARNNFWFDMSQAEGLTAGEVTPFALELDWARLRTRDTEPEPRPTGWTNRWYVSSVELGQGRVQGESSTADGEPNYLGRVQPYGVWVPSGRAPSEPTPLTWFLHSFTINHNQYAATAPETLRALCEGRGSLCATTLGRGPDGQYRGVAELDFWEVWHDLAAHYALDPARTVIGGYSMGGFGTWRIAAMHPDLFAAMFLLSSAATDDLPMAANLREIPYYHDHGALDELVPLTEARATIEELDGLGYRYVFDVHPSEDHIAYSLKDGWRQLVEWLQERDRTVSPRPARIPYTWFPADADADLGIGPDGAWWISEIAGRDTASRQARIDAVSAARPEAAPRAVRSETVLADAEPSPAVRERLRWERGEAPGPRPHVDLGLTNVAALSLDLRRAGLDTTAAGARVTVGTDGRTALTLTGIPAGTRVLLDGVPAATAPAAPVVAVPAGEHTVTFGVPEPDTAPPSPGPAPGPDSGPTTPPLPATGGGGVGLGALLGLLVGLLGRRGLSSRTE